MQVVVQTEKKEEKQIREKIIGYRWQEKGKMDKTKQTTKTHEE
jgi:hypothetical protein